MSESQSFACVFICICLFIRIFTDKKNVKMKDNQKLVIERVQYIFNIYIERKNERFPSDDCVHHM